MIPDDPLGKNGPHLDIFLRKDMRCVLSEFTWGWSMCLSLLTCDFLHLNWCSFEGLNQWAKWWCWLLLFSSEILSLHSFMVCTRRRAPVTPPLLRPPDCGPSSQQQPVYIQALHSAPRAATSTPRPPPSLMPHPTAHWPHSGPPEWHPPRRSPSPSPSPPPQRSPGETSELKRKLYDIFPDQKQRIDRILSDNPYMRDLNALSGLLLG